jgi:hypothetical protein
LPRQNHFRKDKRMTKSALLGAAAMVAAAIGTPALAQPAIQEPGAYLQHRPWANEYGYDYGPTGFWPGDVAVGVVGGAVATADAIVSAPFVGSDSYAYYGHRPARTTCGLQPGATYIGPDGRWYPC